MRRRSAITILTTVCLLLAACGSSGAPGAGPSPTGVASLAWQTHSAPPGDKATLNDEIEFAVAPSNGYTAYWCSVTQLQPTFDAQVWVTHDGAQHWSQAAPLPGMRQLTDATAKKGICKVAIDGGDANILHVEYGFHAGYDFTTSLDGGKSWAQPAPDAIPYETTTAAGTTYGNQYTAASGNGLGVSHDHGATFQPLLIPNAPDGRLSLLGVDPTNTHLLAQETYDSPQRFLLWRSDDSGAHWTSTTLPQTLFANVNDEVARLSSDQRRWAICVDDFQPANSNATVAISCSDDTGVTWTQLPLVKGTYNRLLGIDGAGDVVQQVFGPPNALYRYEATTHQWQSLGADKFAVYAPAPAPGVVWDFNGEQVRVAAYA